MKSILVTGGTGSFGQAFVRHLLAGHEYERIIVFSRDELKQYDMRMAGLTDERLRYFIGDIRDLSRLHRAFRGVDDVVHAAALKQVEACEYNPLEAVKTNVYGTENVIQAALDRNVHRVVMVGTDKAVDPVNLYGATKQTAERLMVDANVYGDTRFSCSRYGNVINSRGSVLLRFQAQHRLDKPLTITDPAMTRFVVTLPQAVAFVQQCVREMRGGEVFVPMLPAVRVRTIADAVTYPSPPRTESIRCRPGEKIHEALLSEHEGTRATAIGSPPTGYYIVQPIIETQLLTQVPGYTSDRAEQLDVIGFRQLAGLAPKVLA